MGGLDLDQVNHELNDATAKEILIWAHKNFPGKLAATSSFQTQSVPLLHLISQTLPDLPVLFLDTGFHFAQTLTFRDQLTASLGLNMIPLRPKRKVKSDGQGRLLYRSDPDLCCYHHKVAPLNQGLRAYDALISGVRAEQTSYRASLRTVERESATDRYRIHPLIGWNKRKLWAYVDQFQLPAHPLFEEGYLSVGCQPCTRPVTAGNDERAGRWAGHQKTECGLHTQISLKQQE